MTEEKIGELMELLKRREILENEKEAFERIFERSGEYLGFTIQDVRQTKGYQMIHFVKDHYGYMNEALHKIYLKYKKELQEVNDRIEKL